YVVFHICNTSLYLFISLHDALPIFKYIDDGSTLKSVVTNELVLINPKGTPPFSAKFNTTVVQSMNAFPRFRDTTGGLYRRFRLIKFNHQYPDTPAGRKIKDEYIYNEELLQWLLKKALTIDTSTIIDTKESKEMVTDIQLESDIVRDRKSTRLNSSHVSISYAVFC